MGIIEQAINDERVKSGRVITWLFMVMMIVGSLAYVWELHTQRNDLAAKNQAMGKVIVEQQRFIDTMLLQIELGARNSSQPTHQLHPFN